MASAADPNYDIHTPLEQFAPGVVMTRAVETALLAQYQTNGFTPLTKAQVLAITGPLPALPSGLKRFADSNPAPRDGWSIDQGASVGGVSDV